MQIAGRLLQLLRDRLSVGRVPPVFCAGIGFDLSADEVNFPRYCDNASLAWAHRHSELSV